MKIEKKKWLIPAVAAGAALIIGGVIWLTMGRGGTDPVYVYDFQIIGMSEFWGDSRESYGPVITDRIQNIFLSETQTVTGVSVKQGDKVKKGDLLMSFDTTLSDLALERKRLELEQLKLQLEDEQDRLVEIKNMSPMQIPGQSDSSDTNGDEGKLLKKEYQISTKRKYNGSKQELALICWLRNDVAIDNSILEAVRAQADKLQNGTAPDPIKPDDPEKPTEPEETETTPGTDEPTEGEETEPEETEETQTGEGESAEGGKTLQTANDGYKISLLSNVVWLSDTTDPDDGTDADKPTGDAGVTKYYVIFKQTINNRAKGALITWQGMEVDMAKNSFRFFDAAPYPDFTLGSKEAAIPEIDFGSGYTSAQLAQMRRDQEKKIIDVQFKIRMTEAEYHIMQTELDDGNIYAQFDGTVVSLLTEEEARMQDQPFLKVSGGGGYYIEGSINELERDELEIGQEVTVMDYRTGMAYTGKVERVGDYPVGDGSIYYGMGNPNSSYYPFVVFVDGEADLIEGMYVDVQYTIGNDPNGIYLQNPYLRTENGSSYVYVAGENGRLEKRSVVTGKYLWGSYTEIRQGLTVEDKIAFPYGKNVKPGVATVPGDYSTLYN